MSTCPACGAPVTGNLGGTLCAACLVVLALQDNDASEESASSRSPVHAYQVVSMLGREPGRMRYLARRQDFHAFVSLEIVSSQALEGLPSDDVFARLSQLRSLRHPAIARLLESWLEESGDWCLVSEYLVGRVLNANPRLPAGRGTPARPPQLEVFDRICEALSVAHSHGVMHGRLGPGAIVLTGSETAEPRLTGFTVTSPPPTLADDIAGLGRILGTLTVGTPFAADAAALADQATRTASALGGVEALRAAVTAWRT